MFYVFIVVVLNLSIFVCGSEEHFELEYVFLDQTNPCRRTCVENAPSMICRYNFTVEWYQTISKACYACPHNLTDCFRPDCITADGIARPIIAVNRQMPGPSIEVCLGDRIIVDVHNELYSDETSIHWHGMHQFGTPHMDGVPYITQCPIHSGTAFRYQFQASTRGTHFWHSHSGMQRSDGMFGALIVRAPKSHNFHHSLYDHDLSDHTLFIYDWDHKMTTEKFVIHHHSDGNNNPPNLLVNGRGRLRNDSVSNLMPLAKFSVQQNHRYRFRIINAGYLNCPIEMSVDNHTLTIIASDGNDLEPVQVQSLVSYAGERFDIIIEADQEVDNYWIRFRGLMDCDERFTSAFQTAILHYESAPDDEPPSTPTYANSEKQGLQLNSLNIGVNNTDHWVMTKVNSLEDDSDDERLKPVADLQFYVAYDFYDRNNPYFHKKNLYEFHQVDDIKKRRYTPQFNNITFRFPPFPLVTQRNLITPDMFCNSSTVSGCDRDFCECTHVLQVPLGDVVELVLIDQGFTFYANHPFHLHGYNFRVIAMDRLGENTTLAEVQQLERTGKIHRKLQRAPIKDTITVADGGYTIIRFHANNPGYWLFHCHIDFHAQVGMAIVFKVGEHQNFPPVPKNFPTCNNAISLDNNYSQLSTVTYEIRDAFLRLFGRSSTTTSASTNWFSLLIILFIVLYI